MSETSAVVEKSLRSVFVGNIPYEATEDKLREIFSQVGPVLSFKLMYDRESGKPKGYGFCEYKDQETALSAMRNLNSFEIGGRPLRVDNACTEKSRMEMQSLMMSPIVESPYGPDIEPSKAPEAISNAVASLPPEQMYELMRQMKLCVRNNPTEARTMLMNNPQLAYALLQAQVAMRIIDPKIAVQILHGGRESFDALMSSSVGVPTSSAPSLIVPPPSDGGIPALNGGTPSMLQSNIPTNMPTRYPPPQPVGPPPSGIIMPPQPIGPPSGPVPGPPPSGPHLGFSQQPPMPVPPPVRGSQNLGPVPFPGTDHDHRQMAVPPRAPPPQPVGDLRTDLDMRLGPPVNQENFSSTKDRFEPPVDTSYRDGGPPPPVGPPSRDPRDNYSHEGRDSRERDPRAGRDPRDNRDSRDPRGGDHDDRDFRSRGYPNTGTATAAAVTAVAAAVSNANDQASSVVSRASATMAQVANLPQGLAGHDQEKASLIMQVLQLSDEQIRMLPPEQQASILQLKEQIQRSQSQR